MKSYLTATLLCLASATTALADGSITRIITPEDKARLERYEQTKAQALEAARRSKDANQLRTMEATLNAPKQSLDGFDMTGNWQCRTMKLGGAAQLVVYGWFKCRVTDDGSGWMLEKLNGSQRTKGMFFDDGNDRMTYLGTGYVAGDRAPKYGSGKPADQAGYAYRTGNNQFRIEFPVPHLESQFDVLELKK